MTEPHPWCPICGRDLVNDTCPPCDAIFASYEPPPEDEHTPQRDDEVCNPE